MEEIAQEVTATAPKSTSTRPRRLPPFLRWAAAGAVTGMLAALVDTFDSAVSGFEGQLGFYLWYALTSLGASLALVGAVLGAWVHGARWLGRLVPGGWA